MDYGLSDGYGVIGTIGGGTLVPGDATASPQISKSTLIFFIFYAL